MTPQCLVNIDRHLTVEIRTAIIFWYTHDPLLPPILPVAYTLFLDDYITSLSLCASSEVCTSGIVEIHLTQNRTWKFMESISIYISPK